MNEMMNGTMGGMSIWMIVGGLIVVALIVAVLRMLKQK